MSGCTMSVRRVGTSINETGTHHRRLEVAARPSRPRHIFDVSAVGREWVAGQRTVTIGAAAPQGGDQVLAVERRPTINQNRI